MSTHTSRPEALRSWAERGIDTAAEWSDMLAEKLNAAADPRAKLLLARPKDQWIIASKCGLPWRPRCRR